MVFHRGEGVDLSLATNRIHPTVKDRVGISPLNESRVPTARGAHKSTGMLPVTAAPPRPSLPLPDGVSAARGQ